MSNLSKRQVSPGAAVAVILVVIILVAAVYYAMMRPRKSEAPFGGKGLPMTKMKGGMAPGGTGTPIQSGGNPAGQ